MSKLYEIVSILILLGLGVWYLYPHLPTAQEKYEKYYTLWKSHNIQKYAYTLRGTSSSRGPVNSRIVVNNNKIISDNLELGYTIDNKFKSIYKEGHLDKASYDSRYGYPKFDRSYIKTDFRRGASDEDNNNALLHTMIGGYSYEIIDFRVLSNMPLTRVKPVCAKYIKLNLGMNGFKPSVQKAYNKTYKNRDTMDMEGAYFLYKGVCRKST